MDVWSRESSSPPRSGFAHVRGVGLLLVLALLALTSPPLLAQNLVINEIMQNPNALLDSAGEWFEVFNPSASGVDINGWMIADNDFDSHVITNGGPLMVPAGGYVVLARNGDSGANGGVIAAYEYGDDIALGNSGDELVLLDGFLTEIDRVEWDGGPTFPDPTGASMALRDPVLDNNLGANWCESTTPFGAGDSGTPGAANDCPVLIPVVVIHEIMQNPNAVLDSDGEWFELLNAGAGPVDINGWTIADNDIDSQLIDNGGPLVIPVGGFVVLGINADSGTNGGVTVDYEYSEFFLSNGADELVLFDGGGAEIDRVEWDGGPSFPDPTGASMALRDAALDNNVGSSWCESVTLFGDGDLGTPGAANDCPVEVSEVVINEILQNPSAVSDSFGEWFELYNPTASDIDIDGWTILDNDIDSHVINNGGSLIVPAGRFIVLARNGDPSLNGGVSADYVYGDDIALGNSGDELVLRDGGGVEIDRVEWDNGATFPDPNGASMALEDPSLDNNLGANWCTSSSPFGDGDLGTPGGRNDCVGRLVINEIDYDQPSSDTAEFIEIKNAGGQAIDLGGYSLELVNGSTTSVYDTIALPAVSLPAGGYFVVCADATTVANCDQVAISSIQNGSPDAVALTFGSAIVDTVSYEGDTAAPYTEGSGEGLEDSSSVAFAGISRYPDGIDTDRNNVDFTFSCITPGEANSSLLIGCTATGPVIEIFDIQGSGLSSPLEGLVVPTRDNVVTAVGSREFSMQTPEERTDGDPSTSDGIFVFTGSAPSVAVGDRVDVTGRVAEFFERTELTNVSALTVASSGNPLPPPVLFDETRPSTVPSLIPELEAFEGMLVLFEGMASGPTNNFGEAGVVVGHPRGFREPGIEFPGLPGLPVWDGNPEVFLVDTDGLDREVDNVFTGQAVAGSGPLSFSFGAYKVLPTALMLGPEPEVQRPIRDRGPGEFTVATLNVFRLFDDVDDPPSSDAQGGERDDFTVASTEDYLTRLGKLAGHIVAILDAPDILAVQEVEKIEVLQDLAGAIAALDPALIYSARLVEGNDVGTIDVGYLVRDTVQIDAVEQLGAEEILTFDGSLLHDRPPLLLAATYVGGGGASFPIQVLNVHNRSLSNIDDPDDGARVRQKRLEQAQSIAEKVQAIQDADLEARLVVTGDFNAFEFSDGYVDVVGQIKGDFKPADNLLSGPDLVDPDLINQVEGVPAEDRYSFIFEGNAQSLDHALTSVSLEYPVQGLEFGRGNADAAGGLLLDAARMERASDHDGLVLFVLADDDEDGVIDELDVCPDTVIPESVPTLRLGINRFALDDDDFVFDTNAPGRRGISYTTGDTAGCSCEQIIAALNLGKGQTRYGCSNSVMQMWVDLVNP
jgi:hypothetical protein